MLHGTRIASDESAFDFVRLSKSGPAGQAGIDGTVTVPDAHLLFNGDFQRSGPDLKIVGGDGTSFLITDYFKAEKRPTLLSPEGAALTADVVEALAGPLAPGQYAQAGAQTSDQPAIGRIEQAEGNATIVRNGVAIAANQGDVVRKGDVVQTGDGGQIAVLFADGSTFSLSANARMVLNDFVFQAGGANNSALISLVQGTIGFVAGQVAKTGDMRVDTPVATMGIRGTAVLIEISANDGQTKFSVLVEPDGTTGSFNLYNKTTGTLLGTVNNSSVGWLVTPAGPLQVIAQQVQKTPGEVQQELNYFQQIFNIFNQGQQNPFDPSQHTTNPQSTKTAGSSQFLVVDTNNSSGNGGNGSIVTVTVTGNGGNNNTPNIDLLNDPEFINIAPIALPDGGQVPQDVLPPASHHLIEAGVKNGNDEEPGKSEATGNVLGNDHDPNPGDFITLTQIVAISPQLHGALQINSNGVYVYTINNDAADYLAEGEVEYDVFRYTITDAFGATATATLTFVIQGTNDAPVIMMDEPVAAALTETAGQTGSQALLKTDGEISFMDVDISDNDHEVTFTVAESAVINGLELNNAELLALFDACVIQTGEDGTDGTIKWNFSAPDYAFDYLAAGEMLTLTYTLTLTDDFGATDTQTVTINIAGSNDAPVIESAVATGGVTEKTDGVQDENSGDLTAEGTITFSDVDLSNTHQVSATLVSSTDSVDNSPTSARGNLVPTITNSSTGDGSGTVTWVYTVNAGALDELAAGQTITQVYNVAVTDSSGTTAIQAVTVTLTGTNDAPVIASVCGIDLIEQTTACDLTHDFAVAFTDVDLSDIGHTASVQSVVAAGVVPPGMTNGQKFDCGPLLDLLAAGAVTKSAGSSTGSAAFSFAAAADVFDYLAAGEEVTLIYTVSVDDHNGGVTSQDITITITGTNDAPEISQNSVAAGAVMESGDLAGIMEAGPDGGLEPTVTLTNAATVALNGLMTGPEGAAAALTIVQNELTVDLATAITIVWDYLDDNYVSAGPNQANINEAFVRLGVEYVKYLQGGGMPLTHVVAKYAADGPDAGNDPDRVQSLHDNLLGNLSTAALTQRFGADATLQAELTALVTAVDSDLLTRPYYAGNEGTSDTSVRGWDSGNGYDAPTATGQLVASDVDNGASWTWSVDTTEGTYGTFALDEETGKWTYTLDDSGAETQALADGETKTETFSVTVTDEHGAIDTVDVTITINGTNDAPVILTQNAEISHNPQTGITIASHLDVADVDATCDEMFTVKVNAQQGILAPVGDYCDEDPTGSGMLFHGTLNQIRAGLESGAIYTAPQYEAGQNGNCDLIETVTLTVEDGKGGSDTTNFIFSVYGENTANLAGTNQKDVIFGTNHDDTLTGGAADDILIGGGGDDTLFGGADADTFVFTPDGGNDTIADFSRNQGDKIDLTAFTGIQDFDDLQEYLVCEGGNSVLNFGNGHSIVVQNLTVLAEQDFIFHQTNNLVG